MAIEDYLVLVVDDEPGLLKVIETVLSSVLKVRIVATESPVKALHILQQEKIALIICDLQMPLVDGTVVLAEARKLHPDIVSILISANADINHLIQSVNKGGIWKFLSKPFRTADLVAVVQEGLEIYDAKKTRDNELKTLKTIAASCEPEVVVNVPHPRVAVHGAGSVKTPVTPKIKTDAEGVPPVIDNRYRIIDQIKRGGTGVIYKAEDLLLTMPVALKVLSGEFTRNKESMTILQNEARIAMQLSHKHIVRLHNLQQTDNLFYIVMEYINGRSFRELLMERGKLPVDIVLQTARILADSLGYAHRRGVFHRDLKPDNIMLTVDGVVKIIDFGISCLTRGRWRDNKVCGTPGYMSPEEIRGDPIDHRADIYSLAITLHEMMSGRLPFREFQASGDELRVVPVSLSSRIPEPLCPVFEKALSENPDGRYDNVADFADALCAAAALMPNEQQPSKT